MGRVFLLGLRRTILMEFLPQLNLRTVSMSLFATPPALLLSRFPPFFHSLSPFPLPLPPCTHSLSYSPPPPSHGCGEEFLPWKYYLHSDVKGQHAANILKASLMYWKHLTRWSFPCSAARWSIISRSLRRCTSPNYVGFLKTVTMARNWEQVSFRCVVVRARIYRFVRARDAVYRCITVRTYEYGYTHVDQGVFWN